MFGVHLNALFLPTVSMILIRDQHCLTLDTNFYPTKHKQLIFQNLLYLLQVGCAEFGKATLEPLRGLSGADANEPTIYWSLVCVKISGSQFIEGISLFSLLVICPYLTLSY